MEGSQCYHIEAIIQSSYSNVDYDGTNDMASAFGARVVRPIGGESSEDSLFLTAEEVPTPRHVLMKS